MSLPQQIRAILFCAFERLRFSPPCDLCMISGKQNLRDLPAAKFGWPRVLRSFESRSFETETIIRGRLLMAKRARQQTHHCINENGCGDRAIREHVIAYGNLQIDKMFDHPLIDSLVMATDD